MKVRRFLWPAVMLLAACSETPVEDQGDEAIAAHAEDIEQEARSLEQAADEAVKAMEEDIDAELAADGVPDPAAEPVPSETEN